MKAKETGRLGEEYTARQLCKDGYTILARNFYSRYGEIDIVAKRGEILAFVEVKTRSLNALDRPGAWVDVRKRRKLTAAARDYLLTHPEDLQPRFDVAEVLVFSGPHFQVADYQYIEGAFFVDETD